MAIVDPRLTLSCPRKVTADSGIDALTHAIEAYTAVDNADVSAAAGRDSRCIRAAIRWAIAWPRRRSRSSAPTWSARSNIRDDLAAREAMSLGAMLAGLAFSNVGVALVHALEYPIGGATHCSHGAGNGMLLPYVMRYNLPGREREFARIAQLLGEDTTGLSEAQAAERAVAAIEKLNRAIGIPARLRELGAKQEQIPEFAEKALGIARLIRVNPRVPTRDRDGASCCNEALLKLDSCTNPSLAIQRTSP